MSAGAVVGRSEVSERLAEARAILGGERSAMRAVWDERATAKQKRVLLSMAGRAGVECNNWLTRSWGELPEYLRSEIVCGLNRFRAWAEEVGL